MSSNDNDALKMAVLRAAHQVLEPLASLLMETGHGVGDLNAVAKRAFVAAAQAAAPSSKRTVSRIASVTGLSRAEVARILADESELPQPATGTPRAERVLQGWWNDAQYQDYVGHPRKLPLQGATRSFAALAKKYSGDTVSAPILEELLRVKAVRQLPDGTVEALRRHVGLVRWSPQGLDTLSQRLRSHFESLLYNLRNPSRPHYERVVETSRLNPQYAARVIRDLTSQMEVIADTMDSELNDTEVTEPHGSDRAMRLGVGFYLFESADQNSESEPTESAATTRPRPAKGRKKR